MKDQVLAVRYKGSTSPKRNQIFKVGKQYTMLLDFFESNLRSRIFVTDKQFATVHYGGYDKMEAEWDVEAQREEEL